MHLRTLRRWYQGLFFIFFLALIVLASPLLTSSIPPESLLYLSPFLALCQILAEGLMSPYFWLALILIFTTLIFGRLFCGWICPLGTLNQAVSYLFFRKKGKKQIEANQWRPFFKTKYVILVILLILALFGFNLSGWLDPLSFFYRSVGLAIFPALGHLFHIGYFRFPFFYGAWALSTLFLIILLLNAWIPRFWCRALCPLGAFLGVLSRFPLFRIQRNQGLCDGCEVCILDCQGADEPQGNHRIQECFVCLNCIPGCSDHAMSYRWSLGKSAPMATWMSRRHFLRSGALAFLFAGFMKSSSENHHRHARAIRPPNALDEEAFLDTCIRCGACMKICPTQGLHPAWFEAGLEGLWTPILVPPLGYCEYLCNLCGEVCPTDAIMPFTLQEKVNKPIQMGLAVIDKGKCLPWANETPCIVCEEMCPTSPKAIVLDPYETLRGKTLQRPRVVPERCIGCGICEYRCPLRESPAIYVVATKKVLLS